MAYLLRNIGTVSLLLFALAGFLGEVAGYLPPEVGASIAKFAFGVLGVARGSVLVAEILKRERPADQVTVRPAVFLDGKLIRDAVTDQPESGGVLVGKYPMEEPESAGVTFGDKLASEHEAAR